MWAGIATRGGNRHEGGMATPPAKTKAQPARKPARPPHLAQGRWLGDFARLSAAEARLVACCARGEIWRPGGWDRIRPEKPTAANTIHAGLIRFLALGGDALHPVHEAGVMLRGAWIEGMLDLHQCRAPVRLDLRHCHFDTAPVFTAAHLPELALSGSHVPGLEADRLNVKGSVFLNDGFNADGEVRLNGAAIGGVLDCSKGSFASTEGYALCAERIKVTGVLYLREAHIIGAIDLAAAQIGSLLDDPACWQSGGHILDGLRYDRIGGLANAARRIAWLKRQRADHLNAEDWAPQPWEQLIKVLREMGHPAEAAEVAMEKQRMMRAARRIGTRQPSNRFKQAWRRWLDAKWTILSNRLSRKFHDFYGWFAGYGYRPTRILSRMVVLWFFCSLAFEGGREFGYFGPSNPLIHASAVYASCGAPGELLPDGRAKAFWHSPACPTPPEYATLYPPLYSLDLILPLVDLQQDSAWAPMVVNERGEQLVWGYLLRALMWFEILAGWFASLMLIAIVSRLVEKD